MGRATGALSAGLAVQVRVHCKYISETTQAALAKQYDELADLYASEAERLRAAKP